MSETVYAALGILVAIERDLALNEHRKKISCSHIYITKVPPLGGAVMQCAKCLKIKKY